MKRTLQILFLSLFITTTFVCQDLVPPNKPYLVELGVGNSLYENVNGLQIIMFVEIPFFQKKIAGLELTSKINFELINENHNSTFLLGYVPIVKYYVEVNKLSFFIQGGIGLNYLNHHSIGRRNLGGHFIFSDMIGIGTTLFQNSNYRFEISYLFRHISNAGFFRDNEGFNSQYILLSFTI